MHESTDDDAGLSYAVKRGVKLGFIFLVVVGFYLAYEMMFV